MSPKYETDGMLVRETKSGGYCGIFSVVEVLNDKIDEVAVLRAENEKLRECVEYYANTEIYRRPDKDREGMSGMSSRTDFEIDDGEWRLDDQGEKDHYCYGKRARAALEVKKEEK